MGAPGPWIGRDVAENAVEGNQLSTLAKGNESAMHMLPKHHLSGSEERFDALWTDDGMGTCCLVASLPTLVDTTNVGHYLQIRRQNTKWRSGYWHSVCASDERWPWPKQFDVVSLTQGNSGTSYRRDQGRGDHQPHTTTHPHVLARALGHGDE
jgi:hypothetical protein